jgi:hypothetical protein
LGEYDGLWYDWHIYICIYTYIYYEYIYIYNMIVYHNIYIYDDKICVHPSVMYTNLLIFNLSYGYHVFRKTNQLQHLFGHGLFHDYPVIPIA